MKDSKQSGKRILLVEDEVMVRRSMKMLLEHDGNRVAAAENGEEALGLFAHEPFDLVITDFSMPGLNGGELAARLKSLRPGQPIILATASIYKLEGTETPLPDVDCILNKPFSFDELRDAIAVACKTRS